MKLFIYRKLTKRSTCLSGALRLMGAMEVTISKLSSRWSFNWLRFESLHLVLKRAGRNKTH
jgi:hypothetical protein